MKIFAIFIILTIHTLVVTGENTIIRQTLPEDGRMNFMELVRKYGNTRMSVQEHDVITEDGYILKVFHVIPATKLRKSHPILLLHGILDSSDSFVIRGNRSLVINLVDAGYDVWAGNSRGNKYSRDHAKLDPDVDKKFWNFTFHESGYYDVPAMIDYVLDKTGHKKVTAIAHSQGTTQLFVFGSLRPEYSEKVNIMIALAPVVFIDHLKPPVSHLVESAPIVSNLAEALGMEELLADHDFTKPIIEIICAYALYRYEFCVDGVIFGLGGPDRSQFEQSFLSVIVGHVPCGSSRKNLVHWAQVALNKRFAQFDYGTKGNLVQYNSDNPPNYNLTKITFKVALFFGKNDGYSKPKDVAKLKKLLPNVVEYHEMERPNWNHFNFVWGRNMDKYLFPHLFRVLKRYD